MTYVVIAAALIAGGALYIRLRWRRSPQAYRAMVVVALCFLAAGAILGAWIVHLAAPAPSGYVEAVGPGAGVGGLGAVKLPNRFWQRSSASRTATRSPWWRVAAASK